MPFAENNGVKIHYQTEGNGPELMLQHGYTTSLDRWYEAGYVDALKSRFKLILVDARGHGQSDKPHLPEDYRWDIRCADSLAVADALGLDRFHFWGYSMGGIYGYQLAKNAAHRLNGLIIGGADPYALSFSAFNDVGADDPEAFISAMERLLNERFTRQSCERMLNNDLRAMIAAAGDRVSVEQEMLDSKVDCLLYVGDQDDRYERVSRFAQGMETAELAIIPGQNHAGVMARGDLVLPAALDYLNQFN